MIVWHLQPAAVQLCVEGPVFATIHKATYLPWNIFVSKFIREYKMLHNCPELISCCEFSQGLEDALTTGRPFGYALHRINVMTIEIVVSHWTVVAERWWWSWRRSWGGGWWCGWRRGLWFHPSLILTSGGGHKSCCYKNSHRTFTYFTLIGLGSFI